MRVGLETEGELRARRRSRGFVVTGGVVLQRYTLSREKNAPARPIRPPKIGGPAEGRCLYMGDNHVHVKRHAARETVHTRVGVGIGGAGRRCRWWGASHRGRGRGARPRRMARRAEAYGGSSR